MTTGGSIGNRINSLRGKTGLSVKEFAQNVGKFSADHLAKMERGDIKEPKYDHIIAIGEYCNVSIDYILTGRDYTSVGMAENQSFVGMGEIADTLLAKSMFKTLHQISTRVETIANGVQKFDKIGSELSNLRALEDTASALSITPEYSKTLDSVQNDARVVNN